MTPPPSLSSLQQPTAINVLQSEDQWSQETELQQRAERVRNGHFIVLGWLTRDLSNVVLI